MADAKKLASAPGDATARPGTCGSVRPKALRGRPRNVLAADRERFGSRLRAAVDGAGWSHTATADVLGVSRQWLESVMAGCTTMGADRVATLPGDVRRALIRSYLADEPGPDVAAYCAGQGLAEAIHELTDVIRTAAASQADGAISVDEAVAELREWDDVERVRTERVAWLREVVRERGRKL